MTRKKIEKRLKELKKEEFNLFDTYKTKNTPQQRASHLERMAAVIREQIKLSK